MRARPGGLALRRDPLHPSTGAPLGRLDVALDGAGRPHRVHVELGGWELRGGAVGPHVLWRRGEREHEERAAGFTGTSPVWAVAAARLLGAAPGPVRLRLVRLGDEALAALVVDQEWARSGEQEHDGVPVVRWDVDDLATGERRGVHLAGDLVVEAPGVRLLELTLT